MSLLIQMQPGLLGPEMEFSALQQQQMLAATVPAKSGRSCECLPLIWPPSPAGLSLYYGGPVCAFWSWVGGEAAAVLCAGWAPRALSTAEWPPPTQPCSLQGAP